LTEAGRANETAQSALGMQTNRSANRIGLRRRDRQRRGAPDSGDALPSGCRIGPSVLAVVDRTREGFAVVLGSVSMRIGDIANVLGLGGDGSIHPADHRFRRAPRCCGWSRVVPDVQSSDFNAEIAEIPKFGP